MFNYTYRYLLAVILTLLSTYSLASISTLLSDTTQKDNTFLPVEEAFSVTGRLDNDYAYIDFNVAPEHYLYKDRFKFFETSTIQPIGQPLYPAGQRRFDPNFNKIVEVFPNSISIKLPVKTLGNKPEILISFQGCATAGLCYPPHKISVLLTKNHSLNNDLTSSSSTNERSVTSDEHYYSDHLKRSGTLLAVFLFFLAGLGLSFTPCVLPMIPIISSLILGKNNIRRSKITKLILTYIFSMSTTFAIAGTLTGFFGAALNLQAKLQSPWLIAPFSFMFVILALSMLGLFELQLPTFIRDKLSGPQKKQGSLASAALLGIFSALIVSPCVSAPLAGSLIYISTTGDAFLGGVSLFALGMGMGAPIMAIGLGGRHILPKAGNWMNHVRTFFAMLLLGVAVWMLERIIDPHITLALWGILLITSSIFLGALSFKESEGYHAFRQAAALTLLTYGICLIVGFAKGNSNPFKPLASLKHTQPENIYPLPIFQRVTTQAALTSVLDHAASQKKSVILDISADWCTSCKTIEKMLLASPKITPLLAPLTLVKFDITDNSEEHNQFLTKNQLFGPPALLFYDPSGNHQSHLKITGIPSIKFLQETINILGRM
ncbi:MAG: protein-disulfide reductase DsbD [Candidatus Endonucleobacter bathymodioli]|uniref:Protein-disulfide reductase DsbD n=1 Tax=Candidatus Endonucleibacter bathymodioli TaxID=539814 RepID=A0AA90NKA9_9GAMM|nr:protein-disulfide reductase DsbD [Candidatus Endonucleobacter bathymodioli]